MTDVKYRPDEWEKAKKALKELSESSGWINPQNKILGYIEDIHENMEEAGNDIRNLDSDGVISFNYEDTTGKFRELLEDFGVLQDFTDKVGDAVDRAIDQPFYKDMDAFATAMRDLSIENYTTKNTIGATEVKVTYTGGYGPDAYKTTERKKDTINMIDILNGNNFFAAKMKVDYDRFKQEHPDEKFSFEDYQHAALNTRAFQYESIEDNQKKKEFWRDIIIGIGLVVGTVAAIACPPAAPAIIALGATYGTLELGSAVSGKDWMTGRELDTGERWLRGAFSLLDIVPGVKGVHAFSKAARGVPEAIIKVANQSATNLKSAAKQGATTVQGMLDTAAMKALGRVRAVKESARESARIALKRAEPGMIKTAQKADEVITNVKNMKVSLQERLVPVEGVIPAAENTHSVENFMKSMIKKLEHKLSPPPRNSGGASEIDIPPAFKQTEFASSYEARYNQTPSPENPKVGFEGTRGESKCTLKPPPDPEIQKILDEAGIDGIQYKNLVPDFSPVAKAQVKIDHMLGGTGNHGNAARRANFGQADHNLAEQLNRSPELAHQFGMEPGGITARNIEVYRNKNKLTWHELNDVKTMQLVPSKINRTFGHLGGVGEINAGAFEPGGFANKINKETILK